MLWELMWQMRRQINPERRKTKMDKRKAEAAGNVINEMVTDISNDKTKTAVRLLVRSGTITAVDYSAGEVIIDEKYTVHLVRETLIVNVEDRITLKKGNCFAAVTFPTADGNCCCDEVAVCVFDEMNKNQFLAIEDPMKMIANALRYKTLSIGQKRYINTLGQGKKYSLFDNTQESRSHTPNEWKVQFELTRNSYSPDTQAAIMRLFSELNNHKSHAREKLDYILNISEENPDRIPIDFKKFRAALDEDLYGMESEKDLLATFMASNEHAGKRGYNILLWGSPGVGKTSLAECAARHCGLPSEIIYLNALENPLELEGLDSSYEGATVGAFSNTFKMNGTSEMVIILDEIGRVHSSKDGNPLDVLTGVLTGKFVDKFLETHIPTTNTVFIATANDLSSIPEAILNRFQAVIEVKDYTAEDKRVIAQKYIIPKLCEKLNVPDLRFSTASINYIIRNYCADAGARDLTSCLEMVVRNCAVREEKISDIINVKEVRMILDPIVDKESHGIRFNQSRDEYSKDVISEIKKLLTSEKEEKNEVASMVRKKLDFLLECKSKGCVKVEKQKMVDALTTNSLISEKLRNSILRAYASNDDIRPFKINIALVGTSETQKLQIARSIATAVGYDLVRISLAGASEENISGTSGAIIAKPGKMTHAIREAGTLKTVFLFENADQISDEGVDTFARILARTYHDAYLDIDIDFASSVFIVSCNNWGGVPMQAKKLLKFVPLEKHIVAERYELIESFLIPETKKELLGQYSVSIAEEAKQMLLKEYASDNSIDGLASNVRLLVERKRTSSGKNDIHIAPEDIEQFLDCPMPEGNFPKESLQPIPGIVKALGVSSAMEGSTFAIETLLLPLDKNTPEIQITGLPKDSLVDSVKLAVSYVKREYSDILKDKAVHIHFAHGAIPKDGPSAGVAIIASILSAAWGKVIGKEKPYDVAFTGEVDLYGNIFAVGGIIEKLVAAEVSCKRVYIPQQNYERISQEYLKRFQCEIRGIDNFKQIEKDIFYKTGETNDEKKKRDSFGRC